MIVQYRIRIFHNKNGRHPSVSVDNGLCHVCQLGLRKYIRSQQKLLSNPSIKRWEKYGLIFMLMF